MEEQQPAGYDMAARKQSGECSAGQCREIQVHLHHWTCLKSRLRSSFLSLRNDLDMNELTYIRFAFRQALVYGPPPHHQCHTLYVLRCGYAATWIFLFRLKSPTPNQGIGTTKISDPIDDVEALFPLSSLNQSAAFSYLAPAWGANNLPLEKGKKNKRERENFNLF